MKAVVIQSRHSLEKTSSIRPENALGNIPRYLAELRTSAPPMSCRFVGKRAFILGSFFLLYGASVAMIALDQALQGFADLMTPDIGQQSLESALRCRHCANVRRQPDMWVLPEPMIR